MIKGVERDCDRKLKASQVVTVEALPKKYDTCSTQESCWGKSTVSRTIQAYNDLHN